MMVPIATGGKAMFSTSMATYSAAATSGALVVRATSPRTTLASTTPSQPTETMMCAVSKSLYNDGDTRRAPRLLRTNTSAPLYLRSNTELTSSDTGFAPLAERQHAADGAAPDEGE